MYDTRIKCDKCNATICKYDSQNEHKSYLKLYKYCPYCGGQLKHVAWSPNL